MFYLDLRLLFKCLLRTPAMLIPTRLIESYNQKDKRNKVHIEIEHKTPVFV